jgi:solute carrier family 25 aspartate/glutamate transporter 12/13
LADFAFFFLLMSRPDPEVDVAFLLIDQRRTGQIQLDDLRKFIAPIDPSLDFSSDFFRRYFGSTGDLSIRQQDFSQFLVDLQREMGKQAFIRAVEERGVDGYLDPAEFVSVIQRSCGWRLPQGVADRLMSIYCHSPTEAGEATAVVAVRAGALKGASVKEVVKSTEASVLADMEQREKNLGMRYFGFGDFLAFQEVLSMLPGIINLIDRAQEIKQGPVSPDDFKVANRVLGLGGRLSRRQVDIVFTLFDLDRDGFVSHEDTVSVCGGDFAQRLVAVRGRNGLLTFAPPPEFRPHDSDESGAPLVAVASRVQLFSLTAIAGALGVITLSPLELIKTRLMNQRITKQGGRLYTNSLDCLRQVLRSEGIFGLYRGLVPQMLGVAPEKAIKLQANNLLRQVFTTDESGQQGAINLPLEIVAGAGAGACQLLVTNPMEIVKTRLILQGETTQLLIRRGLKPPPSQTFRDIVRDLGFPGLYRGALACLLRDIPFSAIYFPVYALCKNHLANRHDEASGLIHKASLSDLLLAGTLAGVPAALLTTPCDVIRLRLQAVPRPGEASYTGIRDCASKIYVGEGPSGFFRGAAARVLRIAPQFGISLLAYEQITQGFGFHQAANPPTNAPVDPRDYRTAFPASALRPKTDTIDSWMRNFGVHHQPSAPPGAMSQARKPRIDGGGERPGT